MAGPWEKYASPEPAPAGPWAKYAPVPPPPAEAQSGATMPAYDAMGNPTGGETAVPAAPKASSGLDIGATTTGGLIEGIPLIGPAIRSGTEKAAAATASLFNGKTYDQNMEFVNADRARMKQELPLLDKGSQMAGSVAGTVPLMVAAPAAFGISGAPLLARTGASTLSGAALAGGDAAVRTDGTAWDKTKAGLQSSLIGGVLGAGAPIAGSLVGAGVRRTAQELAGRATPVTGMSRSAGDMLANDVGSAGGAQAVRYRMNELGPEAMLLDASPSFEGRAQGLVVPSPANTREAIVDALNARNAGKNQRLNADINEAVGPSPVPSQVEAGLAQGRNDVGELYRPVMDGASAVDTSPLAAHLETSAINLRGPEQRAVNQVRQMLDIPGNPGVLDPNPQALLSTRHAIDGMLDSETNTSVVRALTDARRQVDQELTRAVPGIKAVDAQYHELARQSEGLRQGSTILDSGKTAIRPQEMETELTRAVTPQGELVGPSGEAFRLQQGARAEIDRQVGTKANDLVALRNVVKGEGDWNRAKLAQVFGDEQAGQIIGAVDREAAFEGAYNRLVQNSVTAIRSGGAAEMAIGKAAPGAGGTEVLAGAVGGVPAVAAAMGMRGVKMTAHEMAKAADIARNQEVARALIERSGPGLEVLLNQLGRRHAAMEGASRVGESAGNVAQALIQAQGPNAYQAIPERYRLR